MKGPSWTKLAAATGIDFAIAVVVVAIISESKDINLAGDAIRASDSVFGTITFLTGLAGVFLWWFTGTLAARLRQLEGGSGRLAAVVNGSGSFVAGGLALGAGVLFAGRYGNAPGLAPLATGILDGPTLMFPAAVYVGAAGMVGIRAEGLPTYSRVLSRLSIPLSAGLVALAGLQIFKFYAWINDTAYIAFVIWVLLLSIVGVVRWGDIDGDAGTAAPRKPRDDTPQPLSGPMPEVTTSPPRPRKPAPRKKAAPRKAPTRKA